MGAPGRSRRAGESCRAAAGRELAEETGVVVGAALLRPLCAQHRTAPGGALEQRADYYFEVWCPADVEPTRMEPAKASDLRWFDLDALPDRVVPPELDVLRAVRSGDVPAILTFGFADSPAQ